MNEAYFVLCYVFEGEKKSLLSCDRDDSCKKNGFLGTCSIHEMMTELNA